MFTYVHLWWLSVKTLVKKSLPIKVALFIFAVPFVLAALWFGGGGLIILVGWSFETLYDWTVGWLLFPPIDDYAVPD